VASAVDRKAVAREGITVFLCGGESFNRSSPYVYLTEYEDKMLKRRGPTCLRHHRGKIAAIAVGEAARPASGNSVETMRWRHTVQPFRLTVRPDMN
jgi:hypothetical protein